MRLAIVIDRWVRGWRRWSEASRVREGLLQVGGPPDVRRRRRIATVAATGALSSLAVGLRQMGVVRSLPEPPGRIWSTSAVVTSPAAFVLGVPDAPVGALGFTAIMILASRLAADPPSRRPWTARLLAAAAAACAVGAGVYLRDMLVEQRRLCPYCLTTAAASFALLPLVWPEVHAGVRRWPRT
jgi:uncharacterized membrane protein